MTRTHLLVALLALSLSAALTSCGSDTAVDPVAGNATSQSPTSSPSAPTAPSPSGTPETIGDHPAFPHADYTYVLEVQCFCATFGQPVRVTVDDGEVTGAVWTKRAPDHARGDEADVEWLRRSINDVLAEAADPEWDEVEMIWPTGQDHPDQVAIDRIENAIDDEVTYLISDVQPAA